MISKLDNVPVPLIMTEFGQYCCPASGKCDNYNGTYNGKHMGYVDAILDIAQQKNISWTIWSWQPFSWHDKISAKDICNGPVINKRDDPKTNTMGSLQNTTTAGGANFIDLWNLYYGNA